MAGTYTGAVVPIKVKIGLRANGHADHPNWNKLPLAKQKDPATEINGGWIYDKSSGHQDDNGGDSPLGMQWGILMVSEQFANEAVAQFPTLVSKMLDEAELQTFIETRCTAHMDEFRYDTDVLQALKLELDLANETSQPPPVINEIKNRVLSAIDHNDSARGKQKQRGKNWDDMKTERGINLSNTVTPKA